MSNELQEAYNSWFLENILFSLFLLAIFVYLFIKFEQENRTYTTQAGKEYFIFASAVGIYILYFLSKMAIQMRYPIAQAIKYLYN